MYDVFDKKICLISINFSIDIYYGDLLIYAIESYIMRCTLSATMLTSTSFPCSTLLNPATSLT